LSGRFPPASPPQAGHVLPPDATAAIPTIGGQQLTGGRSVMTTPSPHPNADVIHGSSATVTLSPLVTGMQTDGQTGAAMVTASFPQTIINHYQSIKNNSIDQSCCAP